MLLHLLMLLSFTSYTAEQEFSQPVVTDPRMFDTLIWPPPGDEPYPSARESDYAIYFNNLFLMVMDLKDEISSLRTASLQKNDIDLMRDQIGFLHNDVNTWQERMTNFVRKDLGDLDYRLRVKCTGNPVRVKGRIKKTKNGPLINLNVRPVVTQTKQQPTRSSSFSWIWRLFFFWW